MYERVIPLLLLLIWLAPIHGEEGPNLPAVDLPAGIERIADLVYDKGTKRPLHLDLYKEVDTPKRALPLLIYLHGGGYRKGKKEELLESAFIRETLLELVSRGQIIAASVNYGKASKRNPLANLIDDVRKAWEWLRENAAELHLDATRIGLMGTTSGAHLALMVGLDQQASDTATALAGGGSASFIVAIAPPADLVRIAELVAEGESEEKKKIRTQLRMGLSGSVEEVPDAYKKASPINFIRADSPPILVMTGRQDVRFEQSEWLAAAALEAGAAFDLVEVENAGTEFDPELVDMNPAWPELKLRVQKFILAGFDMETTILRDRCRCREQ